MNSVSGTRKASARNCGTFTTPACDTAATAYVRPHDIEIGNHAGRDTVAATLNHATRIGSVVRLELSRSDNGTLVDVELSRERFDHLNVTTGNIVHFKPRRARVFLAESRAGNVA